MKQNDIVRKINIDEISNWVDYPINPKDAISGDPKCKLSIIRQEGNVTPVHQAMILTIEPSTFHYRFERDESWIVLEGSVRIKFDDGKILNMKAGDLISVLGGRDSTWEVFEPFKKFVVITSAES